MNLLSSAALLLALALLPVSATAAVTGEKTQSMMQELQEPCRSEDWRVLLVNQWNPLPEDFAVTLKKLPGGLSVDERAYEDLTNMLEDCKKAGLQPEVCSAYRDIATQKRLHKNKIARLRAAGYSQKAAEEEAVRWVAAPGTSEHHTGLAVDLVAAAYPYLNQRQETTPEQVWLMEHCWEYGFVLRYPSGKSELTGVGYEPWHYRYVGRETALTMREKGLCLEEWITLEKMADLMEPAEQQEETADAVSS